MFISFTSRVLSGGNATTLFVIVGL